MTPGWPADRFSVNISMVFAGLPLLDRPAAAAAAGFSAIESWWPFPGMPVPDPSKIDVFVTAVDAAGVGVVNLNLDGGDRAAGDRGLMCRPEYAARARDHIPVAMDLARRLSCPRINALFGNRAGDTPTPQEWETAEAGYRLAATAGAAIGARILIEPLSPVDAPRYPIRTVADALDAIRRVDPAGDLGLGVLVDVYHLAQTEVSLEGAIAAAGDRIGHVQLSDLPARAEPGTGAIDFGRAFSALQAAGYSGFAGLEFRPTGPAARSLRAVRDILGG